jgi:hypothetical protein
MVEESIVFSHPVFEEIDMTHFHGERLLGGARLRKLEGEINELPIGHDESWSGEFWIDSERLGLVELGRTYLLILDDGRNGCVELTGVAPDEDEQHSLVRFCST